MSNGTFDEYAESYTSSGSFSFFHNEPEQATIGEDAKPRIWLMGLRRSGKTSIQKVVFHKMSPHETLFLEATSDIRVKEIANNALMQFQILDFPGGYRFDDKGRDRSDTDRERTKPEPSKVFQRPGALVFVIDGQVSSDDSAYTQAIEYFVEMAKVAYKCNPKVKFDILINKVDGDMYAHDDHKIDCQREIQQQISMELSEAKLNVHPSFYLTSIYDHSIFEAFSKIVQKLIPQLNFLESLLDSLNAICGIEKSFLFDVISKVYVATDSNPVDMQVYELCTDMIDVVIDVSCIYGSTKEKNDVPYDPDSASVIRMSNGSVLYLREVNKYLALVCQMRQESFAKSGLVDYNVLQFKKALADVFSAQEKYHGAGAGPKKSK